MVFFNPLFFQVITNGVFLGCMYGVAAIGLSLIFGCMQIIFIAQGSVMILIGLLYLLYGHLNAYFSILGFSFHHPGFFHSWFCNVYRLFRRVAKTGQNPSLLLAFGLMVLLERLMAWIFSNDYRTVITKTASTALEFAGVTFSVNRIIVAGAAIIAATFVFIFLKKTTLGKAVRGVSLDREAASLLGINPTWVSSITFSIGIALAGFAGVATSIIYPLRSLFRLHF